MRIRPRFVLPLTLLALAACAGSDPAPGEGDEGERDQALLDARSAADSAASADGTNAPPPPSCDATAVQGLVGEPAAEALVEQARTDAGADQVRMLKPGQAVTLEFNGARLNVEVDGDNRIVSLRCG